MISQTYPFVEYRDAKGCVIHEPAPYLPVRITNPHSGKALTTIALVDTGADACVFPADLAAMLEHNFQAAGVYSTDVVGVSGPGTVYKHTFNFEILMPNQQDVLVSFDHVLVNCIDQEISPLLGVCDCLCRFKVTVDFPRQTTMISM